MAEESPRTVTYRLGSLKGYLPLNDTSISTRGQFLTSLLQNRSHTSLKDINERSPRSINGDEGESEEESDLEQGGPAKKKYGFVGRRLSAFSTLSKDEVLNTPRMRSMRLIGKNNPRYEWYVLIAARACCRPREQADFNPQGAILQKS